MSQQVEAKTSAEGSKSTDGNSLPELREHDVVCEKGRGDHERWPGNRLYRSLINNFKDSYNDLAPVERSGIIGTIATTIKDKNGWFVQRDDTTGKWFAKRFPTIFVVKFVGAGRSDRAAPCSVQS